MTVAAMRARDVVVTAKHRAHARRDRFLADVEMHEPGQLRPAEQVADPLVELAEEDHLLVETPQLRRIVGFGRRRPFDLGLRHRRFPLSRKDSRRTGQTGWYGSMVRPRGGAVPFY